LQRSCRAPLPSPSRARTPLRSMNCHIRRLRSRYACSGMNARRATPRTSGCTRSLGDQRSISGRSPSGAQTGAPSRAKRQAIRVGETECSVPRKQPPAGFLPGDDSLRPSALRSVDPRMAMIAFARLCLVQRARGYGPQRRHIRKGRIARHMRKQPSRNSARPKNTAVARTGTGCAARIT